MQNHTWTVIGKNCIGFAYSGFELQKALVNTSLERYISIDNHTFQKSCHAYCASLGPERGSKWPIDGIKRECPLTSISLILHPIPLNNANTFQIFYKHLPSYYVSLYRVFQSCIFYLLFTEIQAHRRECHMFNMLILNFKFYIINQIHQCFMSTEAPMMDPLKEMCPLHPNTGWNCGICIRSRKVVNRMVEKLIASEIQFRHWKF